MKPELLEKFMFKCSISGHENRLVELFRDAISPYVEEDVKIDVLGNCISYIRAKNTENIEDYKKGEKKIMLVAHADEVGLVVSHIDNNGFLYFQESGAIDTQLLPGMAVDVENKDGKLVRGVIGKKPIHFQKSSQIEKDGVGQTLWIDIADPDKANMEIEKGDQVCFYRHIEKNEDESIYTGAGIDDKIGLTMLVELAERLKGKELNANVYFVASTQEELGGRGAKVAAAEIEPDECIAIDVTHATDYPSVSAEQYGDIKLGKGPVLLLGPNIERNIFDRLNACASKKGIEPQIEPMAKPSGTDANAIQITGKGIATAVVAIPCRYMHTSNEMISKHDVNHAIDLLEEYILQSQKFNL